MSDFGKRPPGKAISGAHASIIRMACRREMSWAKVSEGERLKTCIGNVATKVFYVGSC